MIARINEAKILVNHISCDCKCKVQQSTTSNSIVQHLTWIKNGIICQRM